MVMGWTAHDQRPLTDVAEENRYLYWHNEYAA